VTETPLHSFTAFGETLLPPRQATGSARASHRRSSAEGSGAAGATTGAGNGKVQASPLRAGRTPGTLALTCPHCGQRAVEAAAKLWILRGWILWCSYGQRYEVGCRPCVRRRTLMMLVANLLLGWWCIPWGLFTPLVVLQNLFLVGWQSNNALRDVLSQLGIPYEEVEIDADGLTLEERRVIWSVLHYTSRLARASGSDALNEEGRRIVTGAFDLTSTEPLIPITSAALTYRVPVGSFDEDTRRFLLATVVHLATGHDATPSRLLQEALRIGMELGFARRTVEMLLGITDAGEPRPDDHAISLADARRILGVRAGASYSEVRARYRALLMQWHPDRATQNGIDPDTAEQRTREIVAAYQLMTRTAS